MYGTKRAMEPEPISPCCEHVRIRELKKDSHRPVVYPTSPILSRNQHSLYIRSINLNPQKSKVLRGIQQSALIAQDIALPQEICFNTADLISNTFLPCHLHLYTQADLGFLRLNIENSCS